MPATVAGVHQLEVKMHSVYASYALLKVNLVFESNKTQMEIGTHRICQRDNMPVR